MQRRATHVVIKAQNLCDISCITLLAQTVKWVHGGLIDVVSALTRHRVLRREGARKIAIVSA
jgi:hypothetical protein